MNVKMLLVVSILLVTFVLSYPEESRFFKLEKIAVSSLPEDLIVPDLKSVSVDPRGNVFGCAGKRNGNECFIIKFDEHLKYLKRFGRNGIGPGEFTMESSSPEYRLTVDTNGDVYVIDYNPARRFIIFDNDGNYKKDIMIDRDYFKYIGHVYKIQIAGSGTFIALQHRRELPTQGIIFTLDPPAIKLAYPFNEKKIYMDWSRTFTIDCCGNNPIVDTDSKYIVFGNSQVYKFQVFDRDGNLKLLVEDKERVMTSFSDRELEDIKINFLMPKSGNSPVYNQALAQFNADKSRFNKTLGQIRESKNVIANIMIADERIYVFPVKKDIVIKDRFPVEIYNLKGQVVRKGYFTRMPAEIWQRCVFFYDRDEEDNPLILKYKILDLY